MNRIYFDDAEAVRKAVAFARESAGGDETINVVVSPTIGYTIGDLLDIDPVETYNNKVRITVAQPDELKTRLRLERRAASTPMKRLITGFLKAIETSSTNAASETVNNLAQPLIARITREVNTTRTDARTPFIGDGISQLVDVNNALVHALGVEPIARTNGDVLFLTFTTNNSRLAEIVVTVKTEFAVDENDILKATYRLTFGTSGHNTSLMSGISGWFYRNGREDVVIRNVNITSDPKVAAKEMLATFADAVEPYINRAIRYRVNKMIEDGCPIDLELPELVTA